MLKIQVCIRNKLHFKIFSHRNKGLEKEEYSFNLRDKYILMCGDFPHANNTFLVVFFLTHKTLKHSTHCMIFPCFP